MLRPKLFDTLKTYNRQQFGKDAMAGLIVGIVAIPLAIAFAIASGVSPEKGLYTAIIGGFIISALGGSKVQIGGPTGAFIVIVYGIVQQYGIDGLIIATFLAGVMLIIMGFARLGAVIKFIPHPLIIGFTSGIALIIFSSEIKDFFGLKMGAVPANFLDKWKSYFANFSSLNIYTLLIACAAVIIILLWPKVTHKIPGSLIAILATTAAVQLFHLPVESIGSRFGTIPSSLPSPVIPHLDFSIIKNLIRPAFTIAILGGIESLLSAVVADGMIGGNHRSNMELIAQGTANIFSSIFGGIPATGAIARTAT
ncbi:MAG: SulP family inorganic anion transporter, partial [Ginsengibacter sp.]